MDNFFQSFSTYLPYITSSRFAVAVSGGADSLALCIMLKKWAENNNLQMVALTVDHQLRNNSAEEAQQVHTWLDTHGIQHEVLTWQHEEIVSNLQEHARHARYKLLTEYCTSQNISCIFFAHHALDQYETFFMRLAHASGASGLTCMSTVTQHNGVNIIRPLLDVAPDKLKHYLKSQNQPWIEDPSNENLDFERVQWRKRLNTLCSMGLSPSNILKTREKLHEADTALNWAAEMWLNDNAQFNTSLYFVKLPLSFTHLPTDIMKRIIFKTTSFVRNKTLNAYHFRHNLHGALDKLTAKVFKPLTLGGCYWFIHKSTLYIVREWSRCSVETNTNSSYVYDNRFQLTQLSPNTNLHPVGKENWPALKMLLKENTLPHQVFLSLPCVYTTHKTLEDLELYHNLW